MCELGDLPKKKTGEAGIIRGEDQLYPDFFLINVFSHIVRASCISETPVDFHVST